MNFSEKQCGMRINFAAFSPSIKACRYVGSSIHGVFVANGRLQCGFIADAYSSLPHYGKEGLFCVNLLAVFNHPVSSLDFGFTLLNHYCALFQLCIAFVNQFFTAINHLLS
jgi:hypothetical protein